MFPCIASSREALSASSLNSAAISASRACKKVYMYETPSTLREFAPQLFVNIDDTIALKLKAIKIHQSQSERLFTSPEAITGISSFRANQAGLGWKNAEAFEIVKDVID